MTPRFLRMSYFFWAIVPILLWMAYTNFGLPHLRWSYTWRDDGQGYDPSADRYYTRCNYVGPYGEYTLNPKHGHCNVFEFKKKTGIR